MTHRMRAPRGWMCCAIAAAALATLGANCQPQAADLPRIVSMNACTDQLLLPLADPEQIAGVSRYSGGQSSADQPRPYPVLSGGAEDVLVLKPDIVVASTFDKRSTRELLKANGLKIAEFSLPRSVDEVKAQILRMGEVTAHPDRAASSISRLDAALSRARKAVDGHHDLVLPLSRGRWAPGNNSFIGALLTEIGLINAAGKLGLTDGGYVSLEAIVKLKPDLLLVSQAGNHAADEGEAFLLHPALERFYPLAKRIVIPENLTECGSANLTDALDVLVQQLNRVQH